MEKWIIKEPVPGDIIRIKYMNFYHYGIYLGNGEVVEFGRPNEITKPEDVRVHKIKLKDFCIDEMYQTRKFSFSEKLKKNSSKKVCNIALSHLGDGNYNILYNNCEHFVNLCVFNKKISTQVDNVRSDIKEYLNNK